MESGESRQQMYEQAPPDTYRSAPPVPAAELAGGAPRVTPPTPVLASFWTWLAAAALWLVGGLLFLGARQTLVDSLRRDDTGGLTETQIQQAADLSVITVVVLAVIVAALFAFFAVKLRAGRNWARIVLTVVAVLALIDLGAQGANGGTAVSYVGAVAAVVAAALSYLPRANAYFAEVRQARSR